MADLGRGTHCELAVQPTEAVPSRTSRAVAVDAVEVAGPRPLFVERAVGPPPYPALPVRTDPHLPPAHGLEGEAARSRPDTVLGADARPYCLGAVVGDNERDGCFRGAIRRDVRPLSGLAGRSKGEQEGHQQAARKCPGSRMFACVLHIQRSVAGCTSSSWFRPELTISLAAPSRRQLFPHVVA